MVFVLIGMLVMKFATFNNNQPAVPLLAAGVQQVYNARAPASSKLPTPYAASPKFCINNHAAVAPSPVYPNTDDASSVYGACRNVSVFTRAQAASAGAPLATPASLLGGLAGAANMPLTAVKGAANISYMSQFLLSPPTTYGGSVVGALTMVNVVTDGASTAGRPTVVQAIVHGNFTCQFAGPIYSALLADAVVKQYTPTGSISFAMYPFPLTYSETTVQGMPPIGPPGNACNGRSRLTYPPSASPRCAFRPAAPGYAVCGPLCSHPGTPTPQATTK